MNFDCIIIGGGPAGLSAAYYILRANLSALIFSKGGGALEKAREVENYFGFAEPISGKALLDAGKANAVRLGGVWSDGEVVSLSPAEDGGFTVSDGNNAHGAKAVLLATGKPAQKAPYGLDSYIGRGVSRCAVCDGFFFRGKTVGVLGSGAYALAEAQELAHLAASVTIFTDGKKPEFAAPGNIKVVAEKPLGMTASVPPGASEKKFDGFMLESGEKLPLDGLFVALGTPGASDFAAKLGVETNSGAIAANEKGATNVPGLFAAGDCAGAPYQVSVAVGRGAAAGLAMVEYVRGLK